MAYVPQIVFLLLLGATGWLVRKRAVRIQKNIHLGKPGEKITNHGERLRNMILVAFGQQKMFKRPIPAILHFFIYAGFILINIEVLEIVIDGVFGSHRIFAGPLGGFYTALITFFEFLALAVLVACVFFLIRRNVLRLPRFWSTELAGWPRLDANLILITEILLMTAILLMNASDQVLQTMSSHYTRTGHFAISGWFSPMFNGWSESSLIIFERTAWWFHIVGIMAFALYVTYSKHLHIALAFPSVYFARTEAKGTIHNMPVVTREVKSMLGLPADANAPQGDPGRFGVKDIQDLSRSVLLSAYSCTECGRCTSECPANQTGKKLSPRKVMMDIRDRMEEVGKSLEAGGPGLQDGKSLLGDYISKEEINACTSCQACVEACPVMINPLDVIIEMRRYVSMEESGAPASWNSMFQNIETNFAPWKFSPADRFNWTKE